MKTQNKEETITAIHNRWLLEGFKEGKAQTIKDIKEKIKKVNYRIKEIEVNFYDFPDSTPLYLQFLIKEWKELLSQLDKIEVGK